MRRIAFVLLFTLLATAATAAGQVPDFDQELASQSAVLIDAATGRVLFEKDPHTPRPPASLTKVMTMLLVMEALERGEVALDEVMVTSHRAKSMGGTQLFLETGDEITLEQAMIGMAVESANDAAVVVAEHLAGSVEGFVEMMNRRAAELGMANTCFANPTGLPEEGDGGSMTTAYDIALMARELLRHPQITTWTTIPWDTQFLGRVYIANKNLEFIRTYPGGDGLKTGWTDDAGYCLVATALRDETRMIAVTMKAPTYKKRTEDAVNLLNYGFGHYLSRYFHHKDQVLATVDVDKGRERLVEAGAAEDVVLLLEKADSAGYRTELALPERIDAPIAQGDVLGQVLVLREDEVVAAVDLIATTPVGRAGWLRLVGRMVRNLLRAVN